MARMPDAERLDRYADLALHVGVNVREGQRLVLRSPIEAAPLARRIAAAAYRAGVPYVDVQWSDDAITHARFRYAPDGTFEELPLGRADALARAAERGDAFVTLDARDPDLLADVDPARVALVEAAAQRAQRPFTRLLMADAVPWTILAVPTSAWARKVFPERTEAEGLAALWRAVFTATRVDEDDPVAAWQRHVEVLARRAAGLNASRFAALRFRGPGTDLRVGLADGHAWQGGATRTPSGQVFVPNLPTEEVFTAPHRAAVCGTVRASMPLAYAGRVIEDFGLTFEAGRVVSAHAQKGEDVLMRLLDTDEGARRLGEVALVPSGGPVQQAGVLFYKTLFDENAAIHLALGQGYRFTLRGGTQLDDGDARAHGLNESLAHVDFMIGHGDMDVLGVDDAGGEHAVMRAGRFVS